MHRCVLLVTRGGFDFAEALTYFTSNVAKALEIEKKKRPYHGRR